MNDSNASIVGVLSLRPPDGLRLPAIETKAVVKTTAQSEVQPLIFGFLIDSISG